MFFANKKKVLWIYVDCSTRIYSHISIFLVSLDFIFKELPLQIVL